MSVQDMDLLSQHTPGTSVATQNDQEATKGKIPTQIGLTRVAPYWTPLRTMAKGRWINREILEMVSTEFRDRSIEYYVSCRSRLDQL